jgi:hypothetical protein
MQNSMYYTNSGLTSLPEYQGGGYIDQYGRQRYGLGKFVKKITKPVAKVLDKVVPNEIKPFLPYIAAAVPFVGPALSGTLAAMTPLQLAAVSAGANAFSQLSQEGAAERGLNPISLGLSALSGYTAGAGLQAPGAATASNIVGNIPPGSLENLSGIDSLSQLGYAPGVASTPVSVSQLGSFSNQLTNIANQPLPEISRANSLLESYGLGPTLPQQVSNLGGSTTEFLGNLTRPGMQSIENIATNPFAASGGDYLKAATTLAPGQIAAAGEQAYNAAVDAQKKYEQELLAMGNLAGANKQDQINYIRRAMVSAGFNEDEISSAISRSGFMYGGRVGYGLGSFVKGNVVKPAMQNLKKMKNKVVDFISKMTDDIEIRTQTDYADDSGASFDIYITPKTERGKNTLDQISQMGLAEKQSDGIYFINDINLEEATMSLNERGIKASGVYEPSMKGGDQFESFRTAGQGPYGADYYGYDRLKEGFQSPKRPPMDDVDYDTIPSPTDKPEGFADGGLMTLRMGGMPAEMDLRKGGFVPLGKKERADDVPARLSKNEFVFTAKAVRNAGNGDVRKGAKRMYQVMNQLEARA